MLTQFKSSVAWQVATGFMLGVVGMAALHPAEATRALNDHLAPVAAQR